MVEWKDITEQKDAERQIESLIASAIAGELEQRIDSRNYEGFMKILGEGINQLMNAVVVPVRETKRVAELLAKGDLTEVMEGEFQGEFAELRDAINSSMENLLDMVNKIREGSANIASAAGEIAQGNADLSQRTEEQASSLEETASSMAGSLAAYPPRAWSNLPVPLTRMRITPARPTNWPAAPETTPPKAAKW